MVGRSTKTTTATAMKNEKVFTIVVPIALYKKIEAAARKDDRSMSSLVRYILARHVPGENKQSGENN
jgi:hypothetical protein